MSLFPSEYLQDIEVIKATHSFLKGNILWLYYQLKKYLPVCVLLCILRFSDLANTLPQPGKGQGNGFSPVCTRM